MHTSIRIIMGNNYNCVFLFKDTLLKQTNQNDKNRFNRGLTRI